MTPEVNEGIAVEAIEGNAYDHNLVKSAVARLGRSLTTEVQTDLTQKVLTHLLKDRSRRFKRNLNHWNEYAPERVRDLVNSAIADRNGRIDAFLKSRRKDIREHAYRITQNWDLAEKAVTQTCIELWGGRTQEDVFFRALTMNARNELLLRNIERDRFESLDTARVPAPSARAQLLSELEIEPDQEDFISHRQDDWDPLDILIQRGEQAEQTRMFQRAMDSAEHDRRYRWIRIKNWAQPLGIGRRSDETVTEMASSLE